MMKLVLSKKPKGVTIIEGFPGFGLIGTIGTEFLMDHLETEKIGTIELDEIPAMIAIHQNKVIEPISIHYNKEYNLVFIHAINIGKNLGWKLADAVIELCGLLNAREVISLEGVGSPNPAASRVFYYSSGDAKKISAKLNGYATPLMEGIVVGVTGALLSKTSSVPIVALFAEAQDNMPDSKAAANVIQALDAYLGLKVDPRPLLKQAQEFEKKLKGISEKSRQAEELQESKHPSYVG